MTKAPNKVELQKPVSKAEREARKAFRQVDAEKAITEHEIAQEAFSKNRERLKAERLEREAAAPPPPKVQPKANKMTAPSPAIRRWSSEEEQRLDELLDAGKEAAEIAVKLNRTRQAVYARLQRRYRKRAKQPGQEELGLKAKGK